MCYFMCCNILYCILFVKSVLIPSGRRINGLARFICILIVVGKLGKYLHEYNEAYKQSRYEYLKKQKRRNKFG